MPRLTHQQAIDLVRTAVETAEPKAVAHEIKIIKHEIDGMAEDVEILVRLDDSPEVVSDALIDGLKLFGMRADNGVSFDGTMIDWGRDNLDFCLLKFSVNMMKSCGG